MCSLIYKKNNGYYRELVFIVLYFLFSHSYADMATHDDFKETFGDADFISLATGRAQNIRKAPAVASVVTANEIKEMGALSLQEVLDTVPGIHVSVAPGNYLPTYLIRGITSTFNPHVLLLINGLPMTNVFLGNRGQAWGGMPVESIVRIEIIRGPGSSVHGADAFAGVINVVTKSANNISTSNYGLRSGSFATHSGWVQQTGHLGNIDMFASIELHKTDGQPGIITRDRQTAFDNSTGTNVSLAPGAVNTQLEWMDARLELNYENWIIRTGYQGRRNMGTGAGVAQALDPSGEIEANRYNFDVTFDQPNAADTWDIKVKFGFLNVENKSKLVLFPPGTIIPTTPFTTGGVFPNGLIGNPFVYERHTRLEGDAFYTKFRDHTFRIGIGLHFSDMYKVEERKNFNSGLSPIGSVVDVTDTPNAFIPEKDRKIYFSYFQDEWDLAPDLNLTAGLRFDNYSDFGSTYNPRLALVWNNSYDITTKLLYGRAFRPPSFAELFNIDNPVALGNPSLDPETIDTYEFAVDFHPLTSISSRLNVYYYKMQDIIRFVPDAAPASTITAQNTGKQTGHGVEWEATWKVNDILRISGNYVNQRTRDRITNKSTSHAPQQQIYSKIIWRALPELNAVAQVNWVADRKRVANDNRPSVADYTTLDFTLRHTIKNNWELSLIGKNIFDANAREPSPAPGSILNDLPLAGRSVFFEVRYSN